LTEKEIVSEFRGIFNKFIRALFDDDQFTKLWMIAAVEKMTFGETRQETKNEINSRITQIVQATGNPVQRESSEAPQSNP
jgi:hypothetical protein